MVKKDVVVIVNIINLGLIVADNNVLIGIEEMIIIIVIFLILLNGQQEKIIAQDLRIKNFVSGEEDRMKKLYKVNFYSLDFQYWWRKEGQPLFLKWIEKRIKEMELKKSPDKCRE